MTQLSQQVEAVERERDELKRQLRAVRSGNVVLVRRDGFYQVKTIDTSYARAYGSYAECYRSDPRFEAELLPRYIEEHYACKVVHYRNKGERDSCGRWIFEEYS